jgi:hypothetical protein
VTFQQHDAILKRHDGCFQHTAAPNRNASCGDSIMASKNLRPIRIEGNVAHIPLTQGYEAVIDAQDAHLVAGVMWGARVAPRSVYATRSVIVDGKMTTVQMHRLLMQAQPGTQVDHIDGDGLNNRRSNLRIADRAQNQHNKRISSSNTSGFKGVHWDSHKSRWRARICAYGRRFYLGYFSSPEEAYDRYCEASKKIHGKFGRVK